MNEQLKQGQAGVALATQQNQSQPVVFNFFDAQQFDTMQRISTMFANSDLVPEIYKISDKNPEKKAIANCTIAVEIAQRIGASPLMVMQNMVPIYGRPSWSSKFLIATVNTCGRFNPLQFRFTEKGMLGKVDYVEYEKTWDKTMYNGKGGYKNNPKTSTFDGTNLMDVECVAFTTAKGSDKILESSPISIRMAIKEGWYTKAGSKWPNMGRQMLMYRAASFWTNTYAPELSMGMRTVEEALDIVDVEFEEVPATPEMINPVAKETIGFQAEVKIGQEVGQNNVDISTTDKTNIVDISTSSTDIPVNEDVKPKQTTSNRAKQYKNPELFDEQKKDETPGF